MSVLEQIRIEEGYVSSALPKGKNSPRLYHVHNQNGRHQFYEQYIGDHYLGSVVTKLPAKYPLCLDNGIILECPYPEDVKVVGDAILLQQPPRRKIIYDRDGNKCLACGATDELTLDHIVPSSKGGKSNIDNLQTLCRKCNLQKGNRIRDFRLTTVAP